MWRRYAVSSAVESTLPGAASPAPGPPLAGVPERGYPFPMSILWDSVLAGAAARALDGALRGGRVRAIHLDHSGRSLTMWAREWSLVVHLHPRRGDLLLLPSAEPFASARPLSARVTGVRSLPDERILLVGLRRARGPGVRTLVLEWIPTRWNALVVEGDGAGASVIRHVLNPVGGKRPLAPGLPYLPPPASGRMGAVEALADPTRWPRPREGETEERCLLRSLAWTSPLNVGLLTGSPPEEAAERWSRLRAVGRGELAPGNVLLTTPGGWTPYPLPVPGSEPFPGDLLEAFRAAAERNGGEVGPGLTGVDPELLARLDREIRSAEGRLRGLRRELDRTADPAAVRARGDLLLARFALVQRGSERVVLEDFEGNPVEIPLDPTLPVHENAAALYAEAARIERVRETLPGRIRTASATVERLEAARDSALEGEVDETALEALLPRSPAGRTGGAGSSSHPLPYRTFRSSGGLEIRVGRGARWNDDLTFRHSAPGDVWLHARESAGAHVILRWPGPGNPPARDLREAATLAALHSKARSAGSAPVDWTFRKYVRKPRKAPPGRVRAERVHTLFVEPDPGLPGRLEEGGESAR